MSRRAISRVLARPDLPGPSGAVFLLAGREAGTAKVNELDGVLLACCVPQCERMQRAAQLPARTPEGLQAKASLALRELSGCAGLFPVVASVLRDMAGRVG